MKKPLLALALATFASPAFAADAFKFDASHTYIGFAIDHLGFAKTLGEFLRFDGTLKLDREDLTRSSIEVTIDTASIDTDQPDFDEHLRSADFFHVAEHPAMTFRSTAVEDLGEGRLKVTGDLSLLGTTRPVVLDTRLNRVAMHPFRPSIEVAGFSATTTIDRTAFGMGKYAPAVGTQVEIRIEAEFNREVAAR
ncbi:MAG: polyisoprenoid-binding protein [Xanthomonadaceae bacterium]|jgi:polyisoprenoid-binding protein YceI|nr:polyisoprenoid-binding protein [Xanthomonadaceae bacterium]